MSDQTRCVVRRTFVLHAHYRRCGPFSPCQICSAADPAAAAKRFADAECLHRRKVAARRPRALPMLADQVADHDQGGEDEAA
jgi:hypothetical protein